MVNGSPKTHTLSVLVEDKPGVLARGATLIKVRADAGTRSQVIEAVNLFPANVIDVSPESLTVEATGNRGKLEALSRVLEPFGIREIVQSGVVSMARGPRGIGTVR